MPGSGRMKFQFGFFAANSSEMGEEYCYFGQMASVSLDLFFSLRIS